MVYHDGEPGYIIHMFDEFNRPQRTLCGIIWRGETGPLNLTETEPGCIKCRRILRKHGLLDTEDRQ